ncbi:prolyl oligopeptidase family serine peptidase [Thalassoglobus polymorphus]|uniref:prolyl oligopeptidase n=1 Tax=Thalassoglobus polymorphus TaxID=2527994 RepID=A0A517QS78_9PLAN|nr:prolyl oligopeptidase family serine peptidase [Thalassoglobus polymorphus]QDT34461.1 Prolyl endopeptidase precursor [Thalassoglobus polymorphus]
MNSFPTVLALSGLLVTFSLTASAEVPMTQRIDHFDEYFGQKVHDPYRWLEDDVRESEQVAEWVKKQNEHTFGYLEKIAEREPIRKRLTELWNFEKFGTPFTAGGRLYFYKNDGLQNQYVLYVQDDSEAEPRVLIDPNEWSEDGTVAIGGTAFSDDGRYLAYSIQDAGSDWRTWKVMEIESGKILDDELNWIKFNSPAWTPDGRGFFYGRFPEPVEGAEFQNLNVNQAIYYHRIGESQAEDVLVFHRPDQPEWGYSTSVTEDGRYLIITVHVGTDDRYRVFYKDLDDSLAMPLPLIRNFENEYSFIGNDGPVFFFKTDLDAPRGRVISIDTRKVSKQIEEEGVAPEVPYTEVIPEQPEAMRDVTIIANLFVVESLKDAKTQVAVYRKSGELLRNVEFPAIGSAFGFRGKSTDTETYYSFSSYVLPPTIYKYDMLTGESEQIRQASVDFNPHDYEAKQVFYTSKDGTRVPMFISHKKGIKLDGNNPTLLYGYGGFNIPLTPSFSISRLAWMEMGGVYAVANLRGGGEYGEKWHKAGTKLNKQNVFDDFIAAAEWLIENKYTQTKKLAIQGGSNGGLLVGACMTQRPELFGACLPAVGVMDMLRFHKFTAGRYWTDDYGSSDNEDEFKALLAYSPYHNAKEGVCYPPTLISTADTDDRVVPGHSFKFAAAIQHAQSCDNPILIRIETKAGHGAGKPTSKIIEELADHWAFLVQTLGVELD